MLQTVRNNSSVWEATDEHQKSTQPNAKSVMGCLHATRAGLPRYLGSPVPGTSDLALIAAGRPQQAELGPDTCCAAARVPVLYGGDVVVGGKELYRSPERWRVQPRRDHLHSHTGR